MCLFLGSVQVEVVETVSLKGGALGIRDIVCISMLKEYISMDSGLLNAATCGAYARREPFDF